MIKLVKWLDRKAFLHFRLWEFSLRNSIRPFPWYFFFRVLLLHPVLSIRGVAIYRQLVRNSEGTPLCGHIPLNDIPQLFSMEKSKGYRLVIAPGFCMKPYDQAIEVSTCPSGHGNHRCVVLDRSTLLSTEQRRWPSPCNTCNIGKLATTAFSLGADFYIMTSALDIARDLFIPAIQGKGARLGIFFLCPYSSEAFTFGLTISNIIGTILTFCTGDCSNHHEFTLADAGIKDQQTFVEHTVFEQFEKALRDAAAARTVFVDGAGKYATVGNVYSYLNERGDYEP